MNYLAAIDLEVVVWGLLAIIWVIAQVVGQFTRTDKTVEEKQKSRENMPRDLREFLEGIEQQAGGQQQTEELESSPAPQPARQPTPSPPVVSRAQQAERDRRAARKEMRSATKSSVKSVSQAKKKVNRQTDRITQALDDRKEKFSNQVSRQADHLQNVLGKRFNSSFNKQNISQSEGKIQKVGITRRDEHEGISNLGIQGFKLPSLTLPASADLVSRDIENRIKFDNADDARRALIEALVIAPAVANQPPGSLELNKPYK